MKIRAILFSVIILFLPEILFSQPFSKQYNGILTQLYFQSQPNPKSLAMAMGLVADNEGSYGSYYNPALTSLSSGVDFNISHNYLRKKDADYDYIGIFYSNKKFGALSISKYNWAFGITDGENAAYHNSIHTLNYSREFGNNFFAGLNLDLVHMGFARWTMWYPEEQGDQKSSDAITADIGVLKRYFLSGKKDSDEKIFQMAAALYNFTGTEIENGNSPGYYEALPVILRCGMSYMIKIFPDELRKGRASFQSFTHLEYENTLNGGTFPVIKIGEEIILSDFFIFRVGISSNDVIDSYRMLGPLVTFGAGVKTEFGNFFKTGDNMKFAIDYAGTPPTIVGNEFNILSLKINYIPVL